MANENGPRPDWMKQGDTEKISPENARSAGKSQRPVLPGPGLLLSIVWLILFLLFPFGYKLLSTPQTNHVWISSPIDKTCQFVFVLIVLMCAYRKDIRYRLSLRIPSISTILLAFLLVLPLMIIVSKVIDLTSQISQCLQAPDWIQNPRTVQGLSDLKGLNQTWVFLGIILFGGLIPAFSEEFLFRGIIGRGLVARFGLIPGVLTTALFYSLSQRSPINYVSGFFLGVILHFIYIWSRSLITSLIVNALTYSVSTVAIYLTDGLPVELPGEDQIPFRLLLSTTVLLALLLFLMQRIRVHWETPDGYTWSPGYTTAEQPPPGTESSIRQERLSIAVPFLVLVAIGTWFAHIIMVFE